MADSNPLSIREMQARVILKSTQDAEFRKALLANPRATIEKEFDIALPPQIQIDAIEAPPRTLTLVLPHVPELGADGELKDEDLEAVSGGSKSVAGDFFTRLSYDLSGVGNVIAVGAGNVIAVGAGNVIAVGAGNLMGNLNALG